MAGIETIKLTGGGVTPEQLTDLDERFEQGREALVAGRDKFFEEMAAYYAVLKEAVAGKVIRIVDMVERSFTYYGGRQVSTNWMGGVTDVGEKQYFFADRAKMIGAEVLGVSVEGVGWSSHSSYESDPSYFRLGELQYIQYLKPVLKFGFDGDEYSGPMRSATVEIIGDADEAFTEANEQRELDEIHDY